MRQRLFHLINFVAVVLQSCYAFESLGRLIIYNTDCPPNPRTSVSFSRSGVGPEKCISNKFLSNVDAAGQSPHFKNHCSTEKK